MIRVVVFIYGVALVLISAYQFGIGLMPDSLSYVSAAQNLATEGTFTLYTGRDYLAWPPLYPMILSIASIISLNTFTFALYIQAICFGLSLLFIYELSSSYLKNFPLLLSLLFTSWPLFRVHHELLSEPLFISLTLIATFFLKKSLTNNRYIIALFLSLSLIVIQRYIGVLFFSLASAYMWVHLPEQRRRIFTYTILSLIPLSTWILRNYLLSGTLTGLRGDPYLSMSDNTFLFLEVLSGWFLPQRVPVWTRIVLLGIGITSLFGCLGSTIFRRIKNFETLYLSSYIIAIGIISTMGASDPFTTRILAPIYPFLLLILIGVFHEISHRYHRSIQLVVLSLALIQGVFLYRYVKDKYIQGAGGYATKEWQYSSALEWVRSSGSISKVLASNSPDALYALFDHSSKMIPYTNPAFTSEFWDTLPDSGMIIWFDSIQRKQLLSEEELVNRYSLRLLHRFDDGKVYTLK